MVLKRWMKGRLGNQMFQYAFMRSVQQNHFPSAEIHLDFSKVESEAHRKHWLETDSLSDLSASYCRVEGIHLTFKQKMLCLQLSTILFYYKYIVKKNYEQHREHIEFKFKDVLTQNNIIWHTYGYDNFDYSLIDPTKDIVFFGYYESEIYFYNMRKILKEDFKSQYEPNPINALLDEKIEQTNSVCVSVRRGDFVGNPVHDVCKKEYFEKAINEVIHRLDQPCFFFFSDDIEWVRENIKVPKGFSAYYESGDDFANEKLRLMSKCKHFIISNSSFSWWAQYLCDYPKKIVIAPDRWLNHKEDEEYFNNDIYQRDWILVHV